MSPPPLLLSLADQDLSRLDLAPYDALSIDVFDTAVFRRVPNPADVFDLLPCGRVARLRAEVHARRLAARAGREEVTLADIWAELGRAGADIECELEVQLAMPNPAVLSFVRRAQCLAKTVVFVSDMYLPASTIRQILCRCGYDCRQEAVFVSSEYGVTKGTGRLHRLVAKRLGAHRMLHLGDNYVGDGLQAQRSGATAAVYRSRAGGRSPDSSGRLPHRVSEEGPSYRFAAGFWAQCGSVVRGYDSPNTDDGWWYRFGRTALGPLVASFTVWLEELARADRRQHLFFVSRDAWPLHEAYSSLLTARKSATGPAEGVPGTYVAISRKALADALQDSHACERLRAYLRSVGLVGAHRIGIVDLGWNGTMQDMLARILPEELGTSDIVGYYVGASPKQNRGGPMRGFVWHSSADRDARWRELGYQMRAGLTLLETLLSHTVGALRGYTDDGKPIRAPVAAEWDSLSGQSIRQVQRGALDLACEMWSVTPAVLAYASDSWAAFGRLGRVIVAPTREEIERLGALQHADDADGYWGLGKNLADPVSNLRGALGAISGLRHAQWVPGCLGRLIGYRARHLVSAYWLALKTAYVLGAFVAAANRRARHAGGALLRCAARGGAWMWRLSVRTGHET